ncbi:MAG: hypothetical protein HFJ30_10430 [Clostridia bacterium]|jgi:hypothetical protein|nr:hypothetical protein [Clostridia bacterium]
MKKDREGNKPFQSHRWNEDVGAKAVGYKKSSKEEKEKSKKEFDKILKDRGIK